MKEEIHYSLGNSGEGVELDDFSESNRASILTELPSFEEHMMQYDESLDKKDEEDEKLIESSLADVKKTAAAADLLLTIATDAPNVNVYSNGESGPSITLEDDGGAAVAEALQEIEEIEGPESYYNGPEAIDRELFDIRADEAVYAPFDGFELHAPFERAEYSDEQYDDAATNKTWMGEKSLYGEPPEMMSDLLRKQDSIKEEIDKVVQSLEFEQGQDAISALKNATKVFNFVIENSRYDEGMMAEKEEYHSLGGQKTQALFNALFEHRGVCTSDTTLMNELLNRAGLETYDAFLKDKGKESGYHAVSLVRLGDMGSYFFDSTTARTIQEIGQAEGYPEDAIKKAQLDCAGIGLDEVLETHDVIGCTDGGDGHVIELPAHVSRESIPKGVFDIIESNK